MKHHRQHRGFSLIEVLIVISIAAIMATIAVPSLLGFVNQNRLNRTRIMLANDINSARSEAIKSNARYVICPANSSQTDCAITADWATTGWLVCPALGLNANCDTTKTVTVIRPALSNGLSIKAASTPYAVIFRSIGAATAASGTAAAVPQTFSLTGASGSTPGSVAVAITGAVSTQ